MNRKQKKLLFEIGLILSITLVIYIIISLSSNEVPIIVNGTIINESNDTIEIDLKNYDQYNFTKKEGLWYGYVEDTFWGPMFIGLRYHPSELENIKIYGDLKTPKKNKNINVVFNPNVPQTNIILGIGELGLSLLYSNNVTFNAACSEQNKACDVIIKGCEDVDEFTIFLENTGEPEIIVDHNCLYIKGQDKELVKAVDRYIYYLYEVM